MYHAAKVLAIAVFCWCASSARGQSPGVRELHGRVVDQTGAPVAGVQVGGQLGIEDTNSDPAAPPQIVIRGGKTDADGRFRVSQNFYGEAAALIAYDAASNRGGHAVIEAKDLAKPVEIRIGKLARLRGRINCADDPKRIVEQTFAILFLGEGPARYGYFQSNHARFDIPVPPGEYSLLVGGEGGDFIDQQRKITIKPEQDVVDLGTIGLPYKSLVKMKGKPAPALALADARGAPKTVQVSDYKGKWVLLYFWGYW